MKRIVVGALAALLCSLSFADTKIANLPASGALTGSEIYPLQQTGCSVLTGDTCRTTLGAMVNYTETQLTGPFIVGLFTGCSGVQYLGADGACHSVLATPVTVANGGTGVATLTGIVKGNGTSAFTAATAANIVSLFTTCSGTQYLGADGACHNANSGTVTSVALTVPSGFSVTGSPLTTSGTLAITGTLNVAAGGTGVGTLTGPIKGNGTSAFTAAAAADIVGLFSTCSGTQYLGADGACHNAGGTPAGSNTQVQFNSSGSFGADAGLTYVGSTTQKLTVGTLTNAGSIVSPDGSSGNAANLTVQAGTGAGTGNGGSLTIQGGTSANSGGAFSGNVTIVGGITNGGSAGYVAIDTGANVERLRVLANGAWSVGTGGAATGSSGQVLTSNGSGSAPTWQPATGTSFTSTVKPSDTTRTNNTQSDDPDLTYSSLATGTYDFECFLNFSLQSTNGGIAVGIFSTGGSTTRSGFNYILADSFSTATTPTNQGLGGATALGVHSGNPTTPGVQIRGSFEVTSTITTLAVHWAEQTTNGNGTILQKGSWCRLLKLQ